MVEKQENKTCGYCENYIRTIGDMWGVCRVTTSAKSRRGKKVMYDMDASQCSKFQLLGSVVKADVVQQASGADWLRTRDSDVFETTEESKADRLVWEKHARQDNE